MLEFIYIFNCFPFLTVCTLSLFFFYCFDCSNLTTFVCVCVSLCLRYLFSIVFITAFSVFFSNMKDYKLEKDVEVY